MSRSITPHGTVLWVLGLAVVALGFASLHSGAATISWEQTLAAMLGREAALVETILWEIRLPRVALAIMIGAGLGLAGAALQSLTHNPLAEPGIIGVSALAALGAAIAFYTGMSSAFQLALPLAGIGGACTAIVLLHALIGEATSTTVLVLAGVAVNAIGGALTALVINLSPNPYAAYEIFFWLMGSLADRSLDHVFLVAPFFVAGAILLLLSAPKLDAFALGEDTAHSLGVDTRRMRNEVILASALLIGPAVAVTGVVGFVGLIVPHVLRPCLTRQPGLLLPASALGGAALTLAADLAIRLTAVHGELKLGVVTSLIGAPFFLYLVIKMGRGHDAFTGD